MTATLLRARTVALLCLLLALAMPARADVVFDWEDALSGMLKDVRLSSRTELMTELAVGADQGKIAALYRDTLAVFKGIAEARKLTSLESARMLALIDLAGVDTGIAVNMLKDRYRYWRPIHAIRGRFADSALREEAWEPLLSLKSVAPEFPSGAATSAGVFEAMFKHFNTPGSAITWRNSDTDQVRSWSSPQALAEEMATSRVWGGIHFRNTVDVSRTFGRRVAEEVLATQLLPR